MMEISERANKYAEEKANEAITKALAQAYMDGYRDGYKDREEDIPVDFRDKKTEYVDLGLPSGTLWADDYEKENDKILFLPYGQASKFHLPTEEQWKELNDLCKWVPNYDSSSYTIRRILHYFLKSIDCIGPNGTIIRFSITGRMLVNRDNDRDCYFWLNSRDIQNGNMIRIHNSDEINPECLREIGTLFTGYKLPIRQVR